MELKRVKTSLLGAMGAMVAVSLIGASSASAANWDPQNTPLTATQVGAGTFTFAGGASWSCASADMTLTAVGDLAQTTSFNPIAFGSCVVQPGNLAAGITAIGTWSFTATSTTTVSLTVSSGSGAVIVLHVGALGCDVTIPSPVNIPNNEWNAATHTLTINGAASFPVHASTALCAGSVGTTATWDAKLALPSNVVIT